jgi:hypothetical protein
LSGLLEKILSEVLVTLRGRQFGLLPIYLRLRGPIPNVHKNLERFGEIASHKFRPR